VLADEAQAMTNPENEGATPDPGHSRLRASHADREEVVGVLKAAFVQGRLTRDELDTRVGHALAARTYADLAVLTIDLPAEPNQVSVRVPARPRNHSARKAVKSGAIVVGGIILIMSGTAFVLGQPAVAIALAVFFTILAAVSTALVAGIIATALKVEARHQNRTRGPGGVSGSPALPPSGRTDRRLAAGYGPAQPGGLVLAGPAGRVR
jgi:hypothetical protein